MVTKPISDIVTVFASIMLKGCIIFQVGARAGRLALARIKQEQIRLETWSSEERIK